MCLWLAVRMIDNGTNGLVLKNGKKFLNFSFTTMVGQKIAAKVAGVIEYFARLHPNRSSRQIHATILVSHQVSLVNFRSPF
jgi:hypothetical protein